MFFWIIELVSEENISRKANTILVLRYDRPPTHPRPEFVFRRVSEQSRSSPPYDETTHVKGSRAVTGWSYNDRGWFIRVTIASFFVFAYAHNAQLIRWRCRFFFVLVLRLDDERKLLEKTRASCPCFTQMIRAEFDRNIHRRRLLSNFLLDPYRRPSIRLTDREQKNRSLKRRRRKERARESEGGKTNVGTRPRTTSEQSEKKRIRVPACCSSDIHSIDVSCGRGKARKRWMYLGDEFYRR